MLKRILGLRPEMSYSFYITDFVFRKVCRQNAGVKWAVHHTSTIHCPEKLTKGRGVYPGDSPGVYINAINGVSVGDFTNIGPNVGIVSANHDYINNEVQTPAQPIKIGNFCWIGMGAVILPGVVLGDFTIVGAGAIVSKSFPDGYCVIAGNPARVLRVMDKAECEKYKGMKMSAL